MFEAEISLGERAGMWQDPIFSRKAGAISVSVPLKDAVCFSCPPSARRLDWGRRRRFGVNLG